MPRRATTAFLFCAASVCAQDGVVLFRDTIQPVIEKNCLPCHNAKVKQAGLDLSTFPGHDLTVHNRASSVRVRVIEHVARLNL